MTSSSDLAPAGGVTNIHSRVKRQPLTRRPAEYPLVNEIQTFSHTTQYCLQRYDMGSRECKKAIFDSCGGNENRFWNLEQCKRRCQGFSESPTTTALPDFMIPTTTTEYVCPNSQDNAITTPTSRKECTAWCGNYLMDGSFQSRPNKNGCYNVSWHML